MTPSPKKANTQTLLGDGSLNWQVYPVETILAEKLHSILTKGSANSRARDVYDCDLLLSKAAAKVLRQALQATFKYRGDPLPEGISDAIASIDTSQLKRGWTSATSPIDGADSFDKTFARLSESLKGLGI